MCSRARSSPRTRSGVSAHSFLSLPNSRSTAVNSVDIQGADPRSSRRCSGAFVPGYAPSAQKLDVVVEIELQRRKAARELIEKLDWRCIRGEEPIPNAARAAVALTGHAPCIPLDAPVPARPRITRSPGGGHHALEVERRGTL